MISCSSFCCSVVQFSCSISCRFCWDVLIFEDPKYFGNSWSKSYTVFITNNPPSLHLWWKKKSENIKSPKILWNHCKRKRTVAHKCHGKTKKLWQNKKATAKQNATAKQKSWQHKIASAKWKIHGKITKKSRQN